jgi:hypothetical protein
VAEKELWKHGEELTPSTPETDSGGAAPVGSLDVETIAVSNIVGPLVILYGPADIGKTVTLLRLCSFITAASYNVEVDRTFRSDNDHSKAATEFERQRREEIFAPLNTGAIDFLLLNVTLEGAAYCQILEAPGEHFFPKDSTLEVSHPFYLQRIFQSPARKIFALFFEASLMNNDQRFKAYVGSMVDVLRRHADVRTDRVLLIFNKCDERSDLSRNGRPIETEFKRLLYSNSAFSPLAEFLRASRFARVHFVPFSSGQFGRDRTGKRTFAMSADHYPKALWTAIHDCVKGRWRIWPW